MVNTALGQVDEAKWYDLLGQFKQKAREFNALYQRVLASENIARQNPELYRDYKKLVGFGKSVREKIESITGTVDRGFAWLKGKLGMDGIDDLPDELGALPLIPIAIVAASLAAIAKFTTDAFKYFDKVERFKSLRQEYGAEKAAQMVERLDKPVSFFPDIAGGMQKMILPIVLLGGAWIFRKKLMKMIGQ